MVILGADLHKRWHTVVAVDGQGRKLAGRHAPFNLMLADATGCWHLGNHPLQREPLATGVHGISNGRLDAPWPKTRHLASALQAWVDAGAQNN